MTRASQMAPHLTVVAEVEVQVSIYSRPRKTKLSCFYAACSAAFNCAGYYGLVIFLTERRYGTLFGRVISGRLYRAIL